MIIVWGSAEARPECCEEALALSLQHVLRSRVEPGCISHTVSVDGEDRRRLNFYEEWEDLNALHRHFAVKESAEFVAQLTALCSGQPNLKIFDAARVK